MTHIQRILSFLTVVAPLACISVGCGSEGGDSSTTGGGGSNSTGGEATIAKFCEDIGGPFCDALFACCTDPQVLESNGGTVDKCKAEFSASCTDPDEILSRIREQLDKKTTVLDDARLTACISSLKAMAAGGNACTRPAQFIFLTDCVAAFRGTVPVGGACMEAGDIGFIGCDNGICISGVCVPFLAEGQSCDPNNYQEGACDFPDGQGCIGADGMTKCGPQAPVGAECPLPDGDKTFSCSSMSCGPNGTCVSPTAFGACSSG